jgi:hypothetical protein
VRSFSSLGLGWVNSSGAASSSLSSLIVSRPEVSAVSFSSDGRFWPGLESACLGFFEEPEVGGGKSHCLFPFLQPIAICQNISSLLSTLGGNLRSQTGRVSSHYDSRVSNNRLAKLTKCLTLTRLLRQVKQPLLVRRCLMCSETDIDRPLP